MKKFLRYLAIFLLSSPILIIFILIITIFFFEGRKAYWNNKINGMCEKDGGITIYETIEMDENEYNLYINNFGYFTFPDENKKKQNQNYFRRWNTAYLKRNNPEVRRSEFLIIRKSDNKILGRHIIYSRVGSDFPTFIAHPSSSSCPKNAGDLAEELVKNNK